MSSYLQTPVVLVHHNVRHTRQQLAKCSNLFGSTEALQGSSNSSNGHLILEIHELADKLCLTALVILVQFGSVSA